MAFKLLAEIIGRQHVLLLCLQITAKTQRKTAMKIEDIHCTLCMVMMMLLLVMMMMLVVMKEPLMLRKQKRKDSKKQGLSGRTCLRMRFHFRSSVIARRSCSCSGDTFILSCI